MRILVKVMGFGGGAPLSLLQYVKYWKSQGHEVLVLGKYFGAEELYSKEGIPTQNVKPYLKNKPIATFITIKRTERIIRKYKPDILIWWTEDEAIFGRIISDKLHIPSGYVFAGGKMLSYISDILNNHPVLVFSRENEKDLIEQGFERKYITQISNRIAYDRESIQCKRLEEKNEINAILMSRITDTLYSSIKTTISIIEEVALRGIDIRLRIMGKGDVIDKVEQLISETNKKVGKTVITYEGYIVDTGTVVRNSLVAFGRGRSVIEPIMYGAAGIVVYEDGKFCICNNETYDNIAENNFSGRNINQPSSIEDVIQLCRSILNNSLRDNSSSFEMMRQRILDDYAVDKGYPKIDSYLSKVVNSDYRPYRYPMIISYIKTYSLILRKRISDGKSKA